MIRTGRILVADDDATSRALMVGALNREGFMTVEACDGIEALEQFERQGADLVMMDVDMPRCDGFEVCSALRGSAAGASVPIMMVTGRDDSASIDRAYELGATDFIAKPVSWGTVGHRIRYLLRAARLRADLSLSEQRHRALLGALPDAIVVLNENRTIVDARGAASHPAMRMIRPRVGVDLGELLPADAAARFTTAFDAVSSGENERDFEIEIPDRAGPAFIEGRIARYDYSRMILILRDITQRRRAERRMQELARLDSLTGLPNRTSITEQLATAVADAARTGRCVGVVHLEGDRFARITAGLGVTLGDQVLRTLAQRLRDALQGVAPDGTVARYGGDEFVVVVPALENPEALESVASSLAHCFDAPVTLPAYELFVTSNVGTAVYPKHGDTGAALIHTASAAATLVKPARAATFAHEDASRESSLERLELETDLRRALERDDELELAWQPQVDMRSGRLVGFEALLRWQHPTRGAVGPSVFVPLAEESVLIVPLSDYVLRQSLQQLHQWRALGHADLHVSVNVSGAHFVHSDVAAWVAEHLERASVPAANLSLELTESLLMHDIDGTIRALAAIKALGVGLAVDDFGTGYSSLAYLKRFSLDTLKIDRAFVKDLLLDSEDAAICSALIAMSHRLGLSVVAEGIETAGQFAHLLEEGCDMAQGYLIGRPANARVISPWLASLGPDRLVRKAVELRARSGIAGPEVEQVLTRPARGHGAR